MPTTRCRDRDRLLEVRAAAQAARFNRDAIYVRIDSIFCSSHFKPYAMRIDTSGFVVWTTIPWWAI